LPDSGSAEFASALFGSIVIKPAEQLDRPFPAGQIRNQRSVCSQGRVRRIGKLTFRMIFF
jgi:hypothetical protein